MNPALFSFNLLDTEVLLCEIEAIIKRHCAESGVTTAIFPPGELRKCFSVDSIIEIKYSRQRVLAGGENTDRKLITL